MPGTFLDESILNSLKRPLGLELDYTEFDFDLVLLINGNLMTLSQNGVGKNGFRITGPDETWSDFLGSFSDMELAKTYVYLKTKLAFDPPATSSVLEAYNKEAEEALWRCRIEVENVREEENGV